MDEAVDQTETMVSALDWDVFREKRGRALPLQMTPQKRDAAGGLSLSFR